MPSIESDVLHWLVVKPYVYFETHLKGIADENAATAQIEGLVTPLTENLTTYFQSEITTLLSADGTLSEAAVAAILQPKNDTAIAIVVSGLSKINPVVGTIVSGLSAYAVGLVPGAIATAYAAAVAALKKVA